MPNSRILKLGAVAGLVAIVAAAAAVFSAGASAAGPSVSAGHGTALVGNEAEVSVDASDLGDAGLGAWTIDVVYDTDIVNIADCDAEHGGICNGTFHSNTARIAGVSAFGLFDDTALATITFDCKAVGDSTLALKLSIFADATAGDPQPIEAKISQGSVKCTNHVKPTATPTAKPTATPNPNAPNGDADCDGEVTVLDAFVVLQYVAEIIDSVPCPDAADYDGDGEITVLDAILILQDVAGLLD